MEENTWNHLSPESRVTSTKDLDGFKYSPLKLIIRFNTYRLYSCLVQIDFNKLFVLDGNGWFHITPHTLIILAKYKCNKNILKSTIRHLRMNLISALHIPVGVDVSVEVPSIDQIEFFKIMLKILLNNIYTLYFKTVML